MARSPKLIALSPVATGKIATDASQISRPQGALEDRSMLIPHDCERKIPEPRRMSGISNQGWRVDRIAAAEMRRLPLRGCLVTADYLGRRVQPQGPRRSDTQAGE